MKVLMGLVLQVVLLVALIVAMGLLIRLLGVEIVVAQLAGTLLWCALWRVWRDISDEVEREKAEEQTTTGDDGGGAA